MIQKVNNHYELCCNRCGGKVDLDSPASIVTYLFKNGWKTTIDADGDRMDFCRVCAKQEGMR